MVKEVSSLDSGCVVRASPYSGCFALVCANTVVISDSFNFTGIAPLPRKSDFTLLNSPTCLYRTGGVIYDRKGKKVFLETRSLLLDKTPDYYAVSQTDRKSI